MLVGNIRVTFFRFEATITASVTTCVLWEWVELSRRFSLVGARSSSRQRPLLSAARLRCPLFQVNGIDLRSASHEEAITALRQTPQKVQLVVYRDEAHYRDEQNLEIFPVDLQKKAGRGLGLSIVGKR